MQPAVLAAAAVVIIATGVWLTRTGRPFNTAIVTVHKLVALAGTVAVGLIVRQAARTAPLPPADQAIIVVTALLAIAGFASGGAVTAMQPAPRWVVWLHRVVTWVAIAAVAACVATAG